MGIGVDATVALARARLEAPRLEAGGRSGDDPELAEAATQFEALLMKQLVVALRDSAKLGGGGDENVLTEHLIEDALATHLARSGGVGLAEVIVREADGGLRPDTSGFAAPPLGDYGVPVHDEARAVEATPDAAPARASLADRLPPDHDPWLGDDDAAGTLRRLLGASAKKNDTGP